MEVPGPSQSPKPYRVERDPAQGSRKGHGVLLFRGLGFRVVTWM